MERVFHRTLVIALPQKFACRKPSSESCSVHFNTSGHHTVDLDDLKWRLRPIKATISNLYPQAASLQSDARIRSYHRFQVHHGHRRSKVSASASRSSTRISCAIFPRAWHPVPVLTGQSPDDERRTAKQRPGQWRSPLHLRRRYL